MKFTRLLTLITEVLNKDSETKIDACLTSQMARDIELWSRMYEDKAPWLEKDKIYSMGIPAAVSGELARLALLESETEVTGGTRADYLNTQYKKAIRYIRQQLEYGSAKGGMVLKPYVTSTGISVEYIHGDSFFPINFDSVGKMTMCAFASQLRKGQKIYTKLEIHELTNGLLRISNRAFVSTNDFSLGSEISVGSVEEWSELSGSVTFSGMDRLPFGYFKVPLANNSDSTSPLGVSVFSKAIDPIRKADKRYSQIDWEYEAKETAVHIGESMLKYDKTQDRFIYPDGKDRLYRGLQFNAGATDKPLLDVFSPDIRDSSYYNGLNHQLRLVEFNCSLAYGTLSDPNNVDKTAEEIKSSKQRSFDMTKDMQGALQEALEDMLVAMDFYTSIYHLAPVGSYQTTFNWGDSILSDREKELAEMQQDVTAGIIRKELYIAKKYGVSEEEALKMMPQQTDDRFNIQEE